MKSKLLPLVVKQTFFLYAPAVKILNASMLRFQKSLSNFSIREKSKNLFVLVLASSYLLSSCLDS